MIKLIKNIPLGASFSLIKKYEIREITKRGIVAVTFNPAEIILRNFTNILKEAKQQLKN